MILLGGLAKAVPVGRSAGLSECKRSRQGGRAK